MQEFFNTVLELLKLEKIELSGIKGSGLSERVEGMFTEFSDLMTEMVGKPYDCLDPDSQVRKVYTYVRVLHYITTEGEEGTCEHYSVLVVIAVLIVDPFCTGKTFSHTTCALIF